MPELLVPAHEVRVSIQIDVHLYLVNCKEVF
jgi:hypothetical protein